MMQRDLPQVLPIAKQSAVGDWSQQDFLSIFQSADAAGWVAEVENKIVGFLIYTVTWQAEGAVDESPGATSRHGPDSPSTKPLRIVLRNLAVAAAWHRRGVGKTLLDRLGQKLRHVGDRVQTTVPEANLPAQLLLRKAGFKATRVLRGYYGGEDGYLMERQRG
jgi:ribosomal-protein-alanine N-acetyltransferase